MKRRLSPTRAGRALAVLVFVVIGMVLATPSAAQADWIRDGQWQLTALHARAAWRLSTGAGVTVAVLDSGVDANHPDLVGRVLPGIDLVDGSTDGRTDFVGHGTTVAALIAGRNDDTDGVAGVAPDVRILPVRVLDRENRYGDAAVVAAGVRWAVDHGASILNLSLGGASDSPDLAQAIGYAEAHNVIVVACTGNVISGGPASVWYPARERGVVAVAGLVAGTHGDTPWHGGLSGPQTVLSAPAADLLGARPSGYWRVQGTSFAAPLVAASAALVRSRWPTMSAANVINRLIRTAHDLGSPGRDATYGFGEVDPLTALTATVPPVSRNPLGSVSTGPAATPTPVSAASPWHAGPAGQREKVARPTTGDAGAALGTGTGLRLGAAGVVFSVMISVALVTTRRRPFRRSRPYPPEPWPTGPPTPPVEPPAG